MKNTMSTDDRIPQHGRATGQFWRFALDAYALPGTRERCLALQDEDGADVLVLLFLCWRAAHAQPVEDAALEQLLQRSVALRTQLIEPLRAARRALTLAGRATESAALQQAAKRVQDAELRAEWLQANWLARDAGECAAAPPGFDARALATASLQRYLQRGGLDATRASAAASAFAAGVFGAAPPRV